jgi:hypothetical protein
MRSSPSGRLKKSLRKQIFLFGLSVLLPALVLLVFIVRMNRQDKELRMNRAVEAQQQKAVEIGRYLTNRLGETERTLLQELVSDPATLRTVYRTYPDLVFVGRIVKEELMMPWEGSEAQKLLSERDRSGELILQAQQAEFVKNDLKLAMTLLNRALSSAVSSSQKCFVQLQQGRVQSKLGDEEGTYSLYREMLGFSGDLTDEYGIPFALYAADRLSVLSSDVEPIVERIEDLMEDIR